MPPAQVTATPTIISPVPKSAPQTPPAGGAEVSPKIQGTPYTVDLLFAVISICVAIGLSMSGFGANIVWACIFWAIALSFFLHFIWAYSRNSGKFKKLKWAVILGLPILILVIAWRPVANQYRRQHSIAPTVDLLPKFEVRINDFTNQIVNASIFPIQKGEGIVFYVLNVGSNSANHLTVQFYAPLNSSNITTSIDWSAQPLQRGFNWHVTEPQTHLLTIKTPGALVGSGMEVWGTGPLFISTNITIPIFDRKTLENLDFVISDTNLSSNFIIPFGLLPVEVIISSDEVRRTDKRVFFFNITNNYAP